MGGRYAVIALWEGLCSDSVGVVRSWDILCAWLKISIILCPC